MNAIQGASPLLYGLYQDVEYGPAVFSSSLELAVKVEKLKFAKLFGTNVIALNRNRKSLSLCGDDVRSSFFKPTKATIDSDASLIDDCRAFSGENLYQMSTVGKSTNIVWHECLIGKVDRQKLLQQKGCVIWITGLSGSGKSTLACALSRGLHFRRKLTYVLDGDNVRHGLNSDLSFRVEDRAENIRRIGEVAKLFADAGLIRIASLISPYRKDRDTCCALLPEGDFIEVFVDVPLHVCEERNPKGLYKLARAGKIRGFTGIDDPYEPPLNCETIKELNVKTKNWKELLIDEPFTKEDLITVQNHNALYRKVLLDFDHVKNSLQVDDEDLKKISSDPTYNINVTRDINKMLKELRTEKGRQTAMLGGGGSKAQNERAAALAAIFAARSHIIEDSKSGTNGESETPQGFSIVDFGSASVHERSAAAAKAAPSDKTATRKLCTWQVTGHQ